MTKPGDSLNKYGSSLITASDSCVKPTGNPYDCGNYRNDTTSTAIFNCSPSVNWNSKLVPDSILANNLGCNAYTTTTSGNCDSGMDIWQILLLTCNSLPTLCSVVKFVSDMFNKGDKAASDEAVADVDLDNLVQQVDDLDKKADEQTKLQLLQNLVGQRNLAQTELNNANRDILTIEKTIGTLTENKQTLKDQKTPLTENVQTLSGELSTLSSELLVLEGELAGMKPSDSGYSDKQMVISQKKQAIEQKEKDLNAAKKLVEDKDKAIDEIDRMISEWQLKLAEKEDLVKRLPDEIKKADNAIKKLDKKVKEADYELDTNKKWQIKSTTK